MTSSGNTFDGVIEEFPGIIVDKFDHQEPADLYLLTHFHADHIVGLKKKGFSSKIYCTVATAKLFKTDSRYDHILPYLCPLEVDYHNIAYRGSNIRLSLIKSYHCPGSCMFLLENENKSVLITGDIRAEDWWINQTVKRNPILSPYISGIKCLDQIYLDTTFAYRGEPFIEIPSNTHGCILLTELLNEYPLDDVDFEFCFRDTTLGFEEAWANVVEALGGSINSVPENIKTRLHAMYDENLACKVSFDSISRRKVPNFRCGPGSSVTTKHSISIKQCINFNIVDWVGTCFPVDLNLLSKTERASLNVVEQSSNGNKIIKFRGENWVLPRGGRELLPTSLKLLFSRHSSYSECRELISLLKPREVYPCSGVSKVTWKNGFSMQRIFGDLCVGTKFRYDEEMRSRHGRPLVIERPVCTINRWDFKDCESELDFVRSLAYSKRGSYIPCEDFEFMGISTYGKNYMDHVRRCKDLKLQSIISGRGESSYREKIRSLQNAHLEFRSEKPVTLFKKRRLLGYTSDSEYEEHSHTSSEDEKPRPKLERSGIVKCVKSSFSSQEMSQDLVEDSSLTRNFVIGNSRVDAGLIRKIHNDLRQDSTVWFSLKLNSIN